MTRQQPIDRGSVVVDDDGRVTLIFQRLLRHSIDRVWLAVTTPDELAQWLLRSALIEPHVGGRIEYVSSPEPIVWFGRVLVWDPPRVYEHEFNTDPDPRFARHLQAERTIARWELASHGKSTLLTLRFKGFTPQVAAGFAPGLHAYLERLEAWLDQRPLPDWLARFEELRPLYWPMPK
jgi:uncharacterized protein YndB with AHSA1/START domain